MKTTEKSTRQMTREEHRGRGGAGSRGTERSEKGWGGGQKSIARSGIAKNSNCLAVSMQSGLRLYEIDAFIV